MDFRQQFQRIAKLNLIQNTREELSRLFSADLTPNLGSTLESACSNDELESLSLHLDAHSSLLDHPANSLWDPSIDFPLEFPITSEITTGTVTSEGLQLDKVECMRDLEQDVTWQSVKKASAKQFVCSHTGCIKRFTRKYNMELHMKIHRNQRDFPCEQCDEFFFSRQHLETHKLTHTEAKKPHVCEVCHKSFQTPQNLQNHTRVHTGDKPFSCIHKGCSKVFAEKSTLSKHLASHIGMRKYKCVDCHDLFTQSSSLLYHRRSKHTPRLATTAIHPREETQQTQAPLKTSQSTTIPGQPEPQPIAGPRGVTLSMPPPVAEPRGATLAMPPPVAEPSGVTLSMPPPVAGPRGVTLSMPPPLVSLMPPAVKKANREGAIPSNEM